MFDKLAEIKEEDIEINFMMDGDEYVVLKSDEDQEAVYIGKVVSIDDDFETIVSLKDEEYDKAFDEYMSLIEDIEEIVENEN